MLSQALIDELGTILSEEYGLEIGRVDLTDIANILTGYFDLLSKIDQSDEERDVNGGDKDDGSADKKY